MNKKRRTMCYDFGNVSKPLHSAIRRFRGDIGPVEILLKQNLGDINCRDSKGLTPLHSAVNLLKCSVELIKLLLEHGADVKSTTNSEGNTVMHCTALQNVMESGSLERWRMIVHILLENGSDVNAVNFKGETPLHLFVQSIICSPELIKLLLERGADVNATTRDGNTPLHYITSHCLRDYRISVNMLLDHGSDVNAVNSKGETPLYLALQNRDKHSPEVIKLLLERGADVKATTPEDGNTYLHMLILDDGRELLTCLQILLEHGSDVNAVNSEGNTPLHLTVRDRDSFNISLIELLLSYKADASIKNTEGETAYEILCYLMERDYYYDRIDLEAPLVSILLIPENERGEYKVRSLHIACICHKFETAHQLLKIGFDVDATDNFGNSPLFYALVASYRNVDKYSTIKLMLDYGAEIITGDSIDRVQDLIAKDFLSQSVKRPLVNIVLEHLAKLFTLHQKQTEGGINVEVKTKGYVTFFNVFHHVVRLHNNEYQKLLTYCSTEMQSLSKTKVGKSRITFLDLLFANAKEMAIYARNKKLVKAFKTKKAMFPMYQGMLDAKLTRAIEHRKLIEEASVVLSDAMKFANPSHEFFERTLSYCSNQDLIRIADKKIYVENYI